MTFKKDKALCKGITLKVSSANGGFCLNRLSAKWPICLNNSFRNCGICSGNAGTHLGPGIGPFGTGSMIAFFPKDAKPPPGVGTDIMPPLTV